MMRLAVFASGNGSNFSAIVAGAIHYQVTLLVCDQKDAYVIERAKALGVETLVTQQRDFNTKQEYEEMILRELEKHRIEFIALAGYMRLVGEPLLTAYEHRIINIHPSLLPAFKGKDAVDQALHYGVKVTGVSIHYVDQGIDTGEIIAQEAIVIPEDGSRVELEKAIHLVEHRLYPSVLNRMIKPKSMIDRGVDDV